MHQDCCSTLWSSCLKRQIHSSFVYTTDLADLRFLCSWIQETSELFRENLPDNNNPLGTWQYPLIYCPQSYDWMESFIPWAQLSRRKSAQFKYFLECDSSLDPRLHSLPQGRQSGVPVCTEQ